MASPGSSSGVVCARLGGQPGWGRWDRHVTQTGRLPWWGGHVRLRPTPATTKPQPTLPPRHHHPVGPINWPRPSFGQLQPVLPLHNQLQPSYNHPTGCNHPTTILSHYNRSYNQFSDPLQPPQSPNRPSHRGTTVLWDQFNWPRPSFGQSFPSTTSYNHPTTIDDTELNIQKTPKFIQNRNRSQYNLVSPAGGK